MRLLLSFGKNRKEESSISGKLLGNEYNVALGIIKTTIQLFQPATNRNQHAYMPCTVFTGHISQPYISRSNFLNDFVSLPWDDWEKFSSEKVSLVLACSFDATEYYNGA